MASAARGRLILSSRLVQCEAAPADDIVPKTEDVLMWQATGPPAKKQPAPLAAIRAAAFAAAEDKENDDGATLLLAAQTQRDTLQTLAARLDQRLRDARELEQLRAEKNRLFLQVRLPSCGF